jgi:hypothetical protein
MAKVNKKPNNGDDDEKIVRTNSNTLSPAGEQGDPPVEGSENGDRVDEETTKKNKSPKPSSRTSSDRGATSTNSLSSAAGGSRQALDMSAAKGGVSGSGGRSLTPHEISQNRDLYTLTSHLRGTSNKIELPDGARIRELPSVSSPGIALSVSVIKYLRSKHIKVPALTKFFLDGLDYAPTFAEARSEVQPLLRATIQARAIRESQVQENLTVEIALRTIAEQYDLPAEVIENLVASGKDRIEQHLANGEMNYISSLFSNDEAMDHLGSAFSSVPSLSFSTYETVFAVMKEMHMALRDNVDLEMVASLGMRLFELEEFKPIFAMSKLSTYPLPHKTMSVSSFLHALAERGDPQEIDPDTALPNPALSTTKLKYSKADKKAAETFGAKERDFKTNSTYDQFKYLFVEKTDLEDVTISDLVETLTFFDSSVFALPYITQYQVDLGSRMQYLLRNGDQVGIPVFPFKGCNLFEAPAIKRLLGIHAFMSSDANTGSTFKSQILEKVRGYKKTAQNVTFFSKVEHIVSAGSAILEAFAGFRNAIYQKLQAGVSDMSLVVKDIPRTITPHEDKEVLTLKETRDAKRTLLPHETFNKWWTIYMDVLQTYNDVRVSDQLTAYMFTPSFISNVHPIFDLFGGASALQNHLIPKSIMFFEASTGKTHFRVPFHEIQDGVSYYLSSIKEDDENNVIPEAKMSAIRRLSAGAVDHEVIHSFVEPISSFSPDLEMLIQRVPIEVFSAYARLGEFDSVLKNKVSEFKVVSHFMARDLTTIVEDFGYDTIKSTILQSAQVTPLKAVDSSSLGTILMSENNAVQLNSLKYSGTDRAVPHFSSSQFMDLGSPNIRIIFRSRNQLKIQSTEYMTQRFSVPYPTFAVHESSVSKVSGVLNILKDVTLADLGGTGVDAVTQRKLSVRLVQEFNDQGNGVKEDTDLNDKGIVIDDFQVDITEGD